jgi:hypothetical protein
MGNTGRLDCGADAQPMPCCAHHHGADHHCSHEHGKSPKSQPNPCKGQCEHCGQTVMNDTVAATPHTLALLSWISPIAADGSSALCGLDLSPRSTALIPADLPPPLTSPTLLNLHCALTN